MKTFEERFTAWVDGRLAGAELDNFEKELATHPEAAADREATLKLRALLRENPTAPKLANAEFFNLQLQQRIAAELPRAREPERRTWSFWTLPRLAWAGALSLVIAGVLFQTLIPPSVTYDKAPYFAQVVEAWPAEPGISATTVYSPEDNVTVLWLEGLDPIPAGYKLQ
jgi:anti-sigma factor RsiW